MDLSIIIPAYNEQKYLNSTIDECLSSARKNVEIIVVLNGYEQEVDSRAKVIINKENVGERRAMNMAAKKAAGKYLMRIDAHCKMYPNGWDIKMIEVLEKYPRGIVVPVIRAMNDNWEILEGWYGLCKLLPTMEEKWVNKEDYEVIEPNMAFTGCGFMIAKDFYQSLGGTDETLPMMGAIGPEFALKGWLEGNGCYTRTDCFCGHIFGTGGYDAGNVVRARQMLFDKYHHRYQEILDHFPELTANDLMMKSVDKKHRIITIIRKDEHITKDGDGKPLKKVVELFKYVYEDDGNGPPEEQIREKYAPLAYKIEEQTYYPDSNGNWIRISK